ncbi:MAG TPA: hypothetical protein VGQ59_09545 [Cyclobacteriaceae bacterium]|nr:hypothetical protein [Cyclobacteriaceae bacterium]
MRVVLLFLLGLSFSLSAQQPDSVNESATERISLLIYARVISDANGNWRVDQNIVPNFRLNRWLKLELGIRHGETSNQFGAYYHYKIELQTKSFWKNVRFIARMSDNVVDYTNPDYRRSNYLLIAESKWPLSKSWVVLAAFGYVYSSTQNNSQEGLPNIDQGKGNNYPTYKAGLRYLIRDKGNLDFVVGSYDVFNPYLLVSPFTQTGFDYEITKHTELYSYFRYQFDSKIDVPLNYFLGIGVRLHLL